MAVVVIALGVALAAGVLLANRALRDRFDESVDAIAGVADLQIAAVSGGTFDETVLEQVRAAPGVKAAAPLLVGTTFVPDAAALRLRLIGVDMLDDDSVRVYRRTGSGGAPDDPLVFLNQPDSVLVPRSLAARLGIGLGGSFAVESARGRRTVTVRGVLDDCRRRQRRRRQPAGDGPLRRAGAARGRGPRVPDRRRARRARRRSTPCARRFAPGSRRTSTSPASPTGRPSSRARQPPSRRSSTRSPRWGSCSPR